MHLEQARKIDLEKSVQINWSKFSYQSKKRAVFRTIFCTSQKSISQLSKQVLLLQHCTFPAFGMDLFCSMPSSLSPKRVWSCNVCSGKIAALLSGKLLLLGRDRTAPGRNISFLSVSIMFYCAGDTRLLTVRANNSLLSSREPSYHNLGTTIELPWPHEPTRRTVLSTEHRMP